MSCLNWNYHGLGNVATIRELHEPAKKFAPTVLCVLETQVNKAWVECLRHTLGMAKLLMLVVQVVVAPLGIF